MQFQHLGGQRLVQHQPAGAGGFFGLIAQADIHLAAADGFTNDRADLALDGANVLRQAHADLEVTVVHRAHFPRKAAEVVLRLGVGETSHAVGHSCAPTESGRQWYRLTLVKSAQAGETVAMNASNSEVARPSGRQDDELRPVRITRGFTMHAEGSVLIECGDTRVLCTASVEERTPHFLRGSGEGWVTAEYGMLPRSTGSRMGREAARGKQGGRTMEIQRLIGRSLRAVVDRKALGERTITLDCDVLQADGGTRTASITGAYVALADACRWLEQKRRINSSPLHGQVAAVSVGIYDSVPVLDLDYPEDSTAETDMNVVMNDGGGFIELQGTAEGHAFRRDELNRLIELAEKGINELMEHQRKALAV